MNVLMVPAHAGNPARIIPYAPGVLNIKMNLKNCSGELL